jgi:predicted  nucleic acid-binding Zn-ribbon protein
MTDDSSVENLKNTGVELFENMYNRYIEKDSELVSVKEKLSELETQFNDLTTKHNSLKEKFKKMKSLFD